MSTQIIQNGNMVAGKNVSMTYPESENKHAITPYKQIYTFVGLNNYYNGNTIVANVLLTVVLVLLLLLVFWIIYVMFFSSNDVKIKGGYNLMGGNKNYISISRTPQIVHDIFN